MGGIIPPRGVAAARYGLGEGRGVADGFLVAVAFGEAVGPPDAPGPAEPPGSGLAPGDPSRPLPGTCWRVAVPSVVPSIQKIAGAWPGDRGAT